MEPGAPAAGGPGRGRRRLLQLLLAMLLVALVVGGAVPYVSGAGRAYLSYLVLAERQDADGASLAAAEARAVGGRVVQGYPQIGAVLAYASGGFAQRLRERPGIAAVGATRTATVPSPPGPLSGADFRPANEAAAAADNAQGGLSDPAEQDDWNLAMIGAGDPQSDSAALLRTPAADRAQPAAAPTAAALRGVLVAVLDSGVDDTHPDLRDAVDPRASVSCADGRPDARYGAWRPDEGVSESGHGTHVAGIVGAARDGRGVTGVAPGVRIAAVRLLGPLGQYYTENIVCGMLWAADHGARAINDSYFADPWKYNCPEDPDQAALTQAVARAVAYAQKRGSVVVASAGNDGQDLTADRDDRRSPNDRTSGPPQDRHLGTECIRLPGELPGVVTVSAVDRSGVPAGYTNYGGVTIAAPGGDPDGGVDGAIVSDWPGDRYAALAGTSMAAAHVTGAVAVVAAEHPGWGPDRITDALESAAAANCPPGPDTCGDRRFYGAGLLALP
ncbi:S8 family peptidase [Streptomyces sp. NRRL B-24484]|uniref:S8 family peptidase n=1 Tax=Streptomyces sp. NRRL B-24484 TaxID=1463833 RepID=UPI0004BFFA6E|nr:S8 family serine peptidase [Streptomyces sp. NRRL B-24484]